MRKFGPSFFLALALHLAIVLLFGFSFSRSPEQTKPSPQADIIEATVLDGAEIDAEAERLKQVEERKHQPEVDHGSSWKPPERPKNKPRSKPGSNGNWKKKGVGNRGKTQARAGRSKRNKNGSK